MPARPCAALALALGLIVTIAVAWACALWSPVEHPLPEKPVDVAAIIVADAPRQEFEAIRAGFGYLEYGSTTIVAVDSETGEPWLLQSPIPVLMEARSGWPFPCFTRKAAVNSSDANWLNHGIEVNGVKFGAIEGRRIPLQPVWIGLTLNSMCFGAVMLGCLWVARMARSGWHRAHDNCTECGYPVPVSARCPECGRVAER